MWGMAPISHLVFLILLALCAAGVLARPTRGKGWRGWGLPACFAVAFLALLAHQAVWQLSGAGSIGFQKFLRRYDTRPAAVAWASKGRGRLLDRHGEVLAEAIPGQRWGHTTALGPAGLHVVGYSSRAYGLSGAERVYDARLCGFTMPDGPGDFLRRGSPEDVRLTIDARLQRVAFEQLAGRKGAVVALDPRTGEILALVSSPSAEETDLAAAMRDGRNAPLFNRATQGLYPPGSVFKAFVAALAVQQGRARPYDCPAEGWSVAANTPRIRDTHKHAADEARLDLGTAFAESSNIWFAKAARACGWAAFRTAAQKAGLEDGFTLAACGERAMETAAGQVPDLSQRQNQLAYVGFGQGELLLTPMHVAALTAAIANDGVLVPPHVGPGVDEAPRRVWPADVAELVRHLMRRSVERGTSRGVALPGLEICGKTGTAETSGRDHAWFTCFAPAEKPEIVVTVLVEHGGFGAQSALPIAREVLRAWQTRGKGTADFAD